MFPEVGELRQFSIRKRVDLPEPDGPNNTTKSFEFIFKEISFRIFNPSTEKPTFSNLNSELFILLFAANARIKTF